MLTIKHTTTQLRRPPSLPAVIGDIGAADDDPLGPAEAADLDSGPPAQALPNM